MTFADGIGSIPENLFKNCSGLTEITIPDTVSAIGISAFDTCRNLKKVTLPDSLTEIGNNVFNECVSLNSVTLPDHLETIGYYAFEDTAITEINIPASLKTAQQPFYACKTLNKVTFADGIKSIPENLFKNCSGLTEITIPDSVAEIGNNAFNGCGNLKKVMLPDQLETIGYYAFEDTALTEIRIPASLKTAQQSFYACKSLNKVTFADGIKLIPENLFKHCSGLTEITLPDSVAEIGNQAFSNCRNLKKVTLPEQLETIGYYAFEDTAITEIRIPASLKTAKYPFDSCNALEYAELAEGMETVPEHLFDRASALKTVRLASTTKSIGQYAFASCRKLSKIEPPDIKPDFTASSFEGCDLLFDQRFCLLDRTVSGVTVNSVIGSVSGLAHFTVKYRLDERTTDPELRLDIPGFLTIVPESVVCTDADMTIADNSDRFLLKAHEGTLRFSARVQRTGDGALTAKMRFRFRDSSWEQPVGTVIVTAPELTVSAPETVNGLSAQVCGIAGKEQTVEVYVNDTLAKTTVSDPYTGKYRVTVSLPEGADGTVYQISAKTEATETEKLAVTYRKNAPTVQLVTLFHNKYEDEGLDITDVFTEGRSPVISYNPSRAMQFTVKTTNPELIDRLFVTSTKGQDVQYMEAFYDAEQDLWVTPQGYFIPENRNYVPGTLNISILEKPRPWSWARSMMPASRSWATVSGSSLTKMPTALIAGSSAAFRRAACAGVICLGLPWANTKPT